MRWNWEKKLQRFVKMIKLWAKKRNFFFIAVLVLVATFLRFYNLNWDQGHFFHPDERNVDMAVSRIIFFSQMNPKFFAYGGFSIYLYKAASLLVSLVTNNSYWLLDWGSI